MKLPGIGAVILSTALFAPAAYANESNGAYLGAGIGQASAGDYCSDTAGAAVTSCEDSDTSFKVFGGYRFTPNFSVEAAYVDLGELHATGSFFGFPFDVKNELAGVTLQVAGIAPLGDRFSLMGRIGAIFWDLKSSTTVAGASASTSDTGVDIAVGAGAQFNVTPRFGIRADVDYYPDLGNNDTGEENVTAFTLGVVFSF